MEITLQYFDGCPNWRTTEAHLHALATEGVELRVRYQLIESYEEAVQYGFHGSPTVLVDGVDPFADRESPIGLACRVYDTETGLAGSPSRRQLRRAITRRMG